MAVRVTVDVTRLAAVRRALGRELDIPKLLDQVGGAVESHARERISDTKMDPDGEPWLPWSEKYALTRHGGHSLLQNDGPLFDSLEGYEVDGDEVTHGSNMIYAATQQHGDMDDRGIPARAFLGIGPEDEDEIRGIVEDWVESELRRAA